MSNNIDIEKLKNYINDLEETITPLQKSKSKNNSEATEIKPKITRTVTDKKKEQLENARKARQKNVEMRQKAKKLESAKMLLANEVGVPTAGSSGMQTNPPVKNLSKPPSDIPDVNSESSSSITSASSEPEIVVIKKSKKKKPIQTIKKKKPAKKIIIEESSSESETETESESSYSYIQKKKKDFGKSHKNKRSSVIKVHDHPRDHPPSKSSYQPINFFCD